MTEAKRRPNGAAVAALLSAMIGLFVMGFVHMGTEASDAFKDLVLGVGKAWIPNAQGIGPYSGKETFMLVAWFLSWFVMYMPLKKRDVDLKIAIGVFVVGMALATLFIYTPFIHFILGE